MDRERKSFLLYAKYPKSGECDFCLPEKYTKLIAQYEHCYVSENRFPYTQWELRKVTKHLLIVPRRHVGSLSELTPDESHELMTLLGKYEQDGYDIFARTPVSTTRTFLHQHTHLIKAENRKARGVFFWRKPYILKLFK